MPDTKTNSNRGKKCNKKNAGEFIIVIENGNVISYASRLPFFFSRVYRYSRFVLSLSSAIRAALSAHHCVYINRNNRAAASSCIESMNKTKRKRVATSH